MDALTREQKNSFDENGVLLLPDFFTNEECDSLISRMAEIIDEANYTSSTVFSTTNRTHSQEDYFLTSGDKIRFFYEQQSKDSTPSELSLNKVGHALHDLDPVFSDFVRQEKVAELASDIGFVEPLLLLSLIHISEPTRPY